MSDKSWFSEARFGMMIHWGLYTLLAGEYEGERMGGADDGKLGELGEWAMTYFRIPIKKYEKLAQAFNPVAFDAEEYVKLAKAAGMRYIVITSKHHEGFALFRSRVDAYNVCDATPFKRDIIGELAAACRKYDIKLGLYYSQDMDWHEPDGGGYTRGKKNLRSSWTNDWDFPDNASKDYTRCFEKKIKPQVKEILTGYGDLGIIWFDTPGIISEAQSRELYDMVKQYQPDCLINSRIGNGMGDYQSMGDNQIPSERRNRGMLFETAATLNDTWGYKSYDNNWKSARDVISLLTRLASRNVNYLLNVGPDPLGRIPVPAQDILKEVGAWMQVNGEAVYGTQPSPYDTEPESGPVTEKGDSLYFVLEHPGEKLIIPGILNQVTDACILGMGPVPFVQDGKLVTVTLPELNDRVSPVLKLSAQDGVKVQSGIIELPGTGYKLKPSTAKISENLSLSKGGDMAWWIDEGSLTWEFEAEREGDFEALLTTNAYKTFEPVSADIKLKVNDAELSTVTKRDEDIDPLIATYRQSMVSHIGRVHVIQGHNRIMLTLNKPVDHDMFRFAELRLNRI